MNIFFGVLALILCTAVGYFLGTKYKERKVFFETFNSFNQRLKNEVSFSQKPLSEIIQGFNAETNVFYEIIKNKDKNNEFITKKVSFLDEEEKKTVMEYAETIGKTDKTTQEDYLKSIDGFLSEKINKTSEDYKKYKNLHVKIGFLLGLMVLVALL